MQRVFHKSALNYTMGKIKGNMKNSTWVTPQFYLSDQVPTTGRINKNKLTKIDEKLSTILKTLAVIEKNLYIAETQNFQ